MKKHPWYSYLFLSVFVALSALILFEGATTGNESSRQSQRVAALFDFGSKTPEVIPAESLFLEGDSVLYVGSESKYTPHFLPENTTDQRVKYQILGDKDSVSFDNGTIKGLKEGKITLSITSVSNPVVKAMMDITVERMKLTSISAELSGKDTLVAGMTSKLKLKGNSPDFSLDDVEFHSTDETILTIDEQGYIRTKEPGKASVYACSKKDENVQSSRVFITVRDGEFIPPTSITLPEEITLFAQQNYTVPVQFSENSSDRNYQLEGKGIIISNGKIRIRKVGDYLLKAKTIFDPEIQDTCVIHVKEAKAVSIDFPSTSVQYGINTRLSYSLKSEMKGIPVTEKEVVIESSDPSIARVNEFGYLFGIKKGVVSVTISWKENMEVSKTAQIIITSNSTYEFKRMNSLVRKLIGHFGVFFVTGIFGMLTVYFLFSGKKRYVFMALSLIYGLVLAMLSELLQIFAGGRTPSWNDVGIDTAGYVSAVLFFLLILILVIWIKRYKKAKELEEKEKTNPVN